MKMETFTNHVCLPLVGVLYYFDILSPNKIRKIKQKLSKMCMPILLKHTISPCFHGFFVVWSFVIFFYYDLASSILLNPSFWNACTKPGKWISQEYRFWLFLRFFYWILELFRQSCIFVYLRNKSWKPECIGSFNMDWRILLFYPEPEAKDKIY